MSGTRAPKTIVVYDITGQTDYTIPFEYLARKFVVVTLIGQDRKVLTLNTDYRFTTKTTIGLSDTNPVGYRMIEIRRFTSATDRLVDFHDGSILRAYDLNLSQIQTLHVAEEARDLAGDSLAVDDNGDLDARGRKIVNLGEAENDSDAVTYGMLREFDNSTFNNAQSAKASADAAKVSENKAKASENRAVIAETRAVASAGTAVQAAMDANTSKEAAKASEDIIIPLVPQAEKAASDAAQSSKEAAQAVQDVKDLGAVPVGAIMMFAHKGIPAGYLDLCVLNPTFDVLEYPALAKLYPTGVLPSYLNKYPKGCELLTVGSTGSWMIPEHTHITDISHGHTASQTGHSHTRGTMEISGQFRIGGDGGLPVASTASSGAFYSTGSDRADGYGSGSRTSNTITQFNASRNWTGETSSIAPAIAVSYFSGTKISTGIREALNKGNIVDVNHVKTTFAIKAAGSISDEGLMEVTQIKADVADHETRIKALEAKLNVLLNKGVN